MFQTARDRKLRPGVGRNHPNQLMAAPRDKVAVPAVKFIHQTSVAGPLMLSDFFSEDTVVQTVYLLELLCSLRLFELDTGYLLCIRHKPPNVARRTQQVSSGSMQGLNAIVRAGNQQQKTCLKNLPPES
jgi:hypothetical protein